MLQVRFPNGYTLTYNDVKSTDDRQNGRVWLLDRNGHLIANAPAEAIVEWVRPCGMSKPHEVEDLDNAIRVLHERIYERPYLNGQGDKIADIKRELRDFDARVGDWR